MRSAGTASWSIIVDRWDNLLEVALWFRAAERIEVPAGGLVTAPPDVDPEPSLPSGNQLAEGWLWWWRTSLAASTRPPDLAGLAAFGPPDFEGLAGYPALRDVVRARWDEAHAWHSARKLAGVEAWRTAGSHGREGAVVRAVEAEVGHQAAPFTLRIIVLPVRERQIRSAGRATFLVPEQVYTSSTYEDWLHDLIRVLA